MKKLQKILLSNYFIALIVAVIFYLLFPPDVNFYQADLIFTSQKRANYLTLIDNLDNTKESEQIELSAYSTGPVIKIKNFETKGIKRVIPLKGEWLSSKSGLIGNFDHNSSKELYTTLKRNDSVFLLQVTFTDSRLNATKKLFFLTRMNYFNGKEDLMTLVQDTLDYNQDGFEDIIVTLTAGYTLSPRKLLIADLRNNRIVTSVDIGVKAPKINATFDLNGDGKKEIFTTTEGTNNHGHEADTPFADSNSWLMVFTDSLNFYLPPVAYPSPASVFCATPFLTDDSTRCILALCYNRSDLPVEPELRLYTQTGREIRKMSLASPGASIHGVFSLLPLPETGYSKALAMDYITNRILMIEGNLDIISRNLPPGFQYPVEITVKKSNYRMDFILYNVVTESVCITDENLRHMQVFNPGKMPLSRNIKVNPVTDRLNNDFLLEGKENMFTLTYRMNTQLKR